MDNIGFYIYLVSIIQKMASGAVDKLPNRFADRILSCEIEVQLNQIIPKEIVIQILQLYSKGMEYFESIKSYKYMYFERKMDSLLRSPKILQAMDNQFYNTDSSKKPQKQALLNKQDEITIRHKHQKLFNQLTAKTSNLTADKIKNLVLQNELKLKEVKESIKDQLSEQQKRFQLKMERRKFMQMNKKSLSSTNFSANKSTKDTLFTYDEETDDLCFTPIQNDKSKQTLHADFSSVIQEHQQQQYTEEINKEIEPKVQKS